MIQCAMNGARDPAEHPGVPVTTVDLAADARACVQAGARSLHLHPRAADGRETLGAAEHDAAVAALRAAVPGIELSCSTHEDIPLGGADSREQAIRAWRTPPDLVSLNLSEAGSIGLGAVLLARGIGIEAGVFTVDGARRLLAAPWARDVRRVLVEVVHEHDARAAVALAHAIDELVAPLGRPRLWHGDDRATWAVVDAGRAAGHDVRVGLEDTVVGRDGRAAPPNADQVAQTTARTPGGSRPAWTRTRI